MTSRRKPTLKIHCHAQSFSNSFISRGASSCYFIPTIFVSYLALRNKSLNKNSPAKNASVKTGDYLFPREECDALLHRGNCPPRSLLCSSENRLSQGGDSRRTSPPRRMRISFFHRRWRRNFPPRNSAARSLRRRHLGRSFQAPAYTGNCKIITMVHWCRGWDRKRRAPVLCERN